MFSRYASAISSGTFMTFALLYVMQVLISLQPGAKTDPPTRHPVIFTMAKTIDTPIQAEEDYYSVKPPETGPPFKL